MAIRNVNIPRVYHERGLLAKTSCFYYLLGCINGKLFLLVEVFLLIYIKMFSALVFCLVLVGCLAPPPVADDSGPSGCCDWPSCYDERTGLCLDTCLNTWSQCPGKLFLMNCYSAYMSPFGELPLQCFPDAQPHLQEVEDLGLTGTPAKIREELHKLNAKNCHPRTGICRPAIPA